MKLAKGSDDQCGLTVRSPYFEAFGQKWLNLYKLAYLSKLSLQNLKLDSQKDFVWDFLLFLSTARLLWHRFTVRLDKTGFPQEILVIPAPLVLSYSFFIFRFALFSSIFCTFGVHEKLMSASRSCNGDLNLTRRLYVLITRPGTRLDRYSMNFYKIGKRSQSSWHNVEKGRAKEYLLIFRWMDFVRNIHMVSETMRL